MAARVTESRKEYRELRSAGGDAPTPFLDYEKPLECGAWPLLRDFFKRDPNFELGQPPHYRMHYHRDILRYYSLLTNAGWPQCQHLALDRPHHTLEDLELA